MNKNDEVIANLGLTSRENTKDLSDQINKKYQITKLLDGQTYDRERNIEETKFYLRQTVLDIFEAGKRLLATKEEEGYGEFEKIIKEEYDISPRTARRFMGVYLKLANRAALHDLGRAKLISALSISEEELDKLDAEGTLLGIPKDKLKLMTTREFNAEIKKWKKRTENVEKQNTEKDEKIAKLEKQLADIFNPYTDDLEKEVEKKCHDLFLQVKAKLLYVRNIADQIYEHPELFTEASRMQVVGFTDLILHIAAEFREDIYKHALSEVGEGIPCVERLRCTPIQGNWNPDLVPEAHDIEPAPDKPFTNKEN